MPRTAYDDYQTFLDAGSAGAYAVAHGFDQLPFWRRLAAHPAYDAFWQAQALDNADRGPPSRRCRPCGCRACGTRRTCTAPSTPGTRSSAGHATANAHLVMGPWYHSQVNRSA